MEMKLLQLASLAFKFIERSLTYYVVKYVVVIPLQFRYSFGVRLNFGFFFSLLINALILLQQRQICLNDFTMTSPKGSMSVIMCDQAKTAHSKCCFFHLQSCLR